jgi:serine/threonine protein kinase
VVESSKNYLWDLRDKIGSDATSDVYKARNFTTGEVVLAKVSKLPPVLSNIQSTDKTTVEKTSIFDREIKNINHDNIVRFIDTELVIYSDNSNALLNQEVLFIEYCNGGTVGDILRLPANRYGLTEDIIMQIMKDIINAIKYLHNKNIVSKKNDSIVSPFRYFFSVPLVLFVISGGCG